MPAHDRIHFDTAYSGIAPWDIDGPQPAFVAAQNRIKGSILDSGCGTGELSLYFASRGHKVTGIDFLEEPIRRAKRKASERGIPASFFVMDALALKELPEQFDCVVDSGLFHVFNDDDRKRYVEGLASVLKPGGHYFLLCFSDAEPGEQGPRRVARHEFDTAFGQDWLIESVQPTQMRLRHDYSGMAFSEGGPKGWFVTVKKVT